jgi:hypothetical protein
MAGCFREKNTPFLGRIRLSLTTPFIGRDFRGVTTGCIKLGAVTLKRWPTTHSVLVLPPS